MHKSVRQFYIFCAAIPILLLIIWFFAISKTVDQFREQKRLDIELEKLERAPLQLSQMEQSLERMNAAIGNSSENLSVDQIFRRVSEYVVTTKDLRIINFPNNNIFKKSNYTVYTYTIKMKGNFFNLLKMLNFFEGNKSIGKIVGVDFKVEKDIRTKTKSLMMLMYVQTYTKTS